MLISAFTYINVTDDDEQDQGLKATIGKWGALGSMVIFLITYSSGMATIPWLINSEIYPIFLIGSASSVAAATNWITNFTMTSVFQNTRFVVSMAVSGVISGLCWVFVYFCLAETRGNTIRKNVALLLNKTQQDANQLIDKSQAKYKEATSPIATPQSGRSPSNSPL